MNALAAGLVIAGLHFAYPARAGERSERGAPVLESVHLGVPASETVCLLGPSGVGKSTLLRCVAGLERGYTGRVMLGGRVLDGLAPHERRVGMLFQEPALFPHLDVAGNVAFGLRYRSDLAKAHRGAEVDRWLALVGLADEHRSAVDALSGGQRQRVALARTLAAAPAAVMLDEPLAALDRPLRERLAPELRAVLRAAAIPAIWVTHDETIAHAVADRVLHMRPGGRLTEPQETGAET